MSASFCQVFDILSSLGCVQRDVCLGANQPQARFQTYMWFRMWKEFEATVDFQAK